MRLAVTNVDARRRYGEREAFMSYDSPADYSEEE